MTGKIQTNPAGLLSLLGIKGTGENPSELADGVLAVLELSSFYTARLEHVAGASVGGLTLAGTGATLDVPNNEFWYVQSYAGSVIAGAAGQPLGLALGFQVIANGGLNVEAVNQHIVSAGAAGDQERVAHVANRVHAPGTRLVCQLTRLNAGGVTVAVSAAIVRLSA